LVRQNKNAIGKIADRRVMVTGTAETIDVGFRDRGGAAGEGG
jgi:hypothetical protein